MRGAGQIAELAAIAEPDVGVIVSVGPVHLELLGTVEAVAAAKAELIAGLPTGGHRGGAGRANSCSSRICVRTWRRSPSVRAATCAWCAPRRAARDRSGRPTASSSRSPSSRRTCAATCWPRWPRPARSACVPEGRVEFALTAGPGGATGAARRRHADRRLLQRQPDVDARRPRRPRRDCRARAAQPRRVAILGDMLELGRRRARIPRRDRRAGARAPGVERAGDRRAAGGGDVRALRGHGPLASATPPRRRSWSRACCAPATWSSSRARAASASSWSAARCATERGG